MDINEYNRQINRSLSYSDDDVLFGDAPNDLIGLGTLTRMLLESGGCAFGHPVFEKELFSVFHGWYGEGKYLKVWMYAQSLLDILPDDTWSEFREKLTDFASGDWTKHVNIKRCPWPGLPEQYLKNWDWEMHEFSINFWDEKKKFYRMQQRLIFVERSI